MDPSKAKDAAVAFAILSSDIMTNSNAVLAVVEETVAELTLLMKHHREYVEGKREKNRTLLAHCPVIDHRQLPRDKRRKFVPHEALHCIMWNFLGPDPLHGSEFKLMFGMSRSQFE